MASTNISCREPSARKDRDAEHSEAVKDRLDEALEVSDMRHFPEHGDARLGLGIGPEDLIGEALLHGL
jgi:hypothetical protein